MQARGPLMIEHRLIERMIALIKKSLTKIEATLYGQLTIPMTPGDQLFVYTDGIIDAPNPEGECFGLARLKNVLDANTKTPLFELKSAVLRTLYQHTKKELTHDDITMIALEIVPKASALRKEGNMI
jgi:hypothetical protein